MQVGAKGDRQRNALANAANAGGDNEFGRYYGVFFHRFKRGSRMNPQASMAARLKNGTSNNPSTSSLMAINCDMDVGGPDPHRSGSTSHSTHRLDSREL